MTDYSTFGQAKAMRRVMTPPEARLWSNLRGGRLNGLKFRRQHPIGPFIVDFYCSAAMLAVEVDGMAHVDPEQASRDRRRDAWLASRGVSVLRVNASEVRDEIDGVLETIFDQSRRRIHGRAGDAPS